MNTTLADIDPEIAARDQKLPLDPLLPNAATIAALEEARSGNLRSFATVQELMDDLNADYDDEEN